ncbi:PVC-type heme-binding CxxCH protein [Roseiconus nitratireducens]|nr:PVC-type heme-binding CxxCH protein [Roseiconus nitratireducens]
MHPLSRRFSGDRRATMWTSLRHTTVRIVFSLIVLWTVPLPSVVAAPAVSLGDGDRVVLIGDGLIEQEQYFGWVEVMMTTAFPSADVTFRNLGWNADTPAGQSRFGLSLVQAGREEPDEGWRQLQRQIELTRPTVAVFGYGMANALEIAAQAPEQRAAGLQTFEANFQRLIDATRGISPDCRFVFLSPIRPVGDALVSQNVIDQVTGIVSGLSERAGGVFVDLRQVATEPELRKDPIHLNAAGYRALATAIEEQAGLKDGRWQDDDQTEPLRQAILEKNRLWFHRSRPANMAYVFGFRKHEQGQNAAEIPQFDALIVKQEQRIASLRGLDPSEVPSPQPRLESKFAEFTPQTTPEFVVGDGLEVTLWAENPLLNKPIHMNFDAQGRLWVASSEAYPMIEVGQGLPDKVLVLEDSDGDGTADQSTVFADSLLIPTGIAPGDGGVYVAQSTDLLFLQDTDGDGQADRRERVLSGFGTEDTHHNLHTLVFGPDGRLYMNQSVYTRTDTETPHGVVRLKAGGGFRFDTQSKHMEVFFRGLWNPWGHQFDALGNSFMTDGAGFEGIAYVFPGATFNPTPGARRTLDLISPGSYPKFCGAEIIRSESFPEAWQGSFVTCDFRANRVTRFSLQESGSGFVASQEDDLLRTSESTFRPIDVKLGPDGALYIADWSNPIINHGEVDFRDPRRDRWHGRIWRVTTKGRPSQRPLDLTKQSTDELFAHLISDDRYRIAHARRLLIERSEQTAARLSDLWSLCETPQQHIQALRLSAAVGASQNDWLDQLLSGDDGNARAAATRVLAHWSNPGDPSATIDRAAAMMRLEKLVVDDNPRTRLEAVRAFATLGGLDAARQSLQALNRPLDRFIEHALFLMVDQNADALIANLQDPVWGEANQRKPLEFVLLSVQPEKAKQFLGQYLAEHEISRDGSGPWIELIAKAGGPEELAVLYRQTFAGNFDPQTTVRALQAMAEAATARRVRPDVAGKPGEDLKPLLSSDDPRQRAAAVQLCGAWKVRWLVPQLAEIAGTASNDTDIRTKAIASLRACGGDAAIEHLTRLATTADSRDIQVAAVEALAAADPGRAVQPFYHVLADVESEQQALTLWRAMLSAKNGESLLIDGLPGDAVTQVAARAGVRAAREGGRDAPALVEALMPKTGLTMTAAEWTPERALELRQLVTAKGDAERGELVYRRTQLQCVTCHAIGGVGGKVGPDMTSLGASAPIDYIIESLFDPNAKIKENYHSVVVLTESGQVFSGIESGSTDTEIVLRDASNQLVRIPEADVLEVKQGQSLMPAALLDRISQQDQLDLIRFLTQLGKPGPYDASRQNVARVLEVLAGTHRIEQQGNQAIISGERTEGWKPLQARVSGKIDRETLRQLTAQPRNIALVNLYLRTKIQAGSETQATFDVDNLQRGTLWIDGKEVGSIGEPVPVPAGEHTLLLQIDARDLPESIAIRSDDVTFTSK